MVERKTSEEVAQGSQGQDDHADEPPATDKDNESQPPPLPVATQDEKKKGANRVTSEDGVDMAFEDNTSEAQPQSAFHVCINNT